MTILLAGATGTIGRATLRALRGAGHRVVCPVRAERTVPSEETVVCDLTRPGSLTTALGGTRVEAVISCMSTRTGAPADARAVEVAAHEALLTEGAAAGATRFVQLSAICVQKPRLAFQHAKLEFEASLQASGLNWTIIRPTAYFKSLSGQVARVQRGKPFMVFGDGQLTACKPISDRDLARYIVNVLEDTGAHRKVLPIGGPGPAITPLGQAGQLFDLLGQAPCVRHVPVTLMRTVAGTLSALAPVSARLRDRAEFARTGLYYATESMLVWDGSRYNADATPETGSDTLRDHYALLLTGTAQADLGAHAVF
ncbi:MAG: NAD(P)H-binding protein [Pseudomonadota bacterium]